MNFFAQPRAVWAVAFACVIAFMGLGLVDPILPAIAQQLHANPSQVELLFTSYMLVTGVAMLVTRAFSSWFGPKWAMLIGLACIVIFSALAGHSETVAQIVYFRGGWGLGNALFIATALAVIVEVSVGGTATSVILYEAALGLGISVGPLLGGTLGSISWRGPFYGVAVLMTIAFVLVAALLPRLSRPALRETAAAGPAPVARGRATARGARSAETPRRPRPAATALIARLLHNLNLFAEPIRALRHRGLLTMGLTALMYNFGFFTLLAFSPFVLGLDALGLGYVYFGWGVLLALTSVFAAPRLQRRFGTLPTMYAMLALIALDLLTMAVGIHVHVLLVVAVILAGAFLGVNNTLVTTTVMEVAPVERPVASAAYSFVRFTGGGIAPWLAGKLAEWFVPSVPFYVGAVAVAAAMLVLASGRRFLRNA